MKIWYTIRNKFGPNGNNENHSWEKYIKWSKLTHLKEVISLDGILCKFALEIDYSDPIVWEYIIDENNYEFYSSINYILNQLKNLSDYHVLAVVKEPTSSCEKIEIPNFKFVGHDLIDKDYSISALTNCGGFDESFLPSDLNDIGLIPTYEKAISIRKKIFKNNPDEFHADCFIFALWKYID